MVETVVLQVSTPYRRTGFTVVLKILTFVLVVSFMEPQMLFNCLKAAATF